MDTAPLTSHQVLDPSYWFDLMYRFFYWLFTFLFRPETWDGLQVPLTLLSIFFISIILYCIIRLFEIRKKEHAHLEHEIHEYAESQREKEKLKLEKESVSHNEHWRQVLTYLFSEDTSSWKLAIMEADVMLDILMGQLGFKGEGLGEKLKMADQDTFRQLSRAWEVHTIRNRTAHEGLAFDLSQHEAKRVIAIYEQIFHEFGYI